jgi:hypothetical protein
VDFSGTYDSDPGTHRFNPRTAAPALKQAMADLARQTGRSDSELNGIALGEAYQLACSAYGDDLPAYWKNWQTWNVASKQPPAPMGDL